MQLTLRPFGQHVQDLDLDFAQASAPHLVTELLHCCALTGDGPLDEERLWNLTVGERIAGLLRLVALGGGAALEVRLRCEDPSCHAWMEVALPVAPLIEAQRKAQAETPLTVEREGRRLVLRRPAGTDQLRWQEQVTRGYPLSPADMISSLLVEPGEEDLAETDIQAVSDAMEAFDPLVYFRVETGCPACGRMSTRALSLQALALKRLQHRQQRLLEEVHRLALHYHWGERQILALPAHRRRRYLALLEREPA